MHFEIVSVLRELNKMYSCQLLLDLTMDFMVLICIFYLLYFAIISSSLAEILNQKEMLTAIFWILILSSKVIILNHQCTCFHREVKLYILLYIFTMTKVITYNINIGIF